ncbi:xanthine dehydrogenase family protein molybdopterin-binding subunit [Caballeronia sp. LjRoot31]|uniref:xanthine dehydrogenase family protein molybdopterin-binding subunit n=1 Tax=Caballeronia sp. LjRoot31 TaxID=3342324 RepID=UPI003ECCF5CD
MTPHIMLDHMTLSAPDDPRPDALAKLGGNPGYPGDRIRPDQLHAAILGSPHAHAKILAIDTRAAMALPGVHAVVTHADIPGSKHHGLRIVDRPFLCIDKCRFIGDPIAAVAADTRELAQQALALIDVSYALLPSVFDTELATQHDAPQLHERPNLLYERHHRHGNTAAAALECDHIVDRDYRTPRQMHAYLETESGVAEPDGNGGILIYFGCHNPERDRKMIAGMLALHSERVRVVGSPVGGSHGGKDELSVQPILALLAWKTGRPVRLHLQRPQSVDLSVKRHSMTIRMRTGCDAHGRLRFHEAWITADTGAYASYGPEVLDGAREHSSGPYKYDAVALESRLVYTNNGIAGAFRGFGAVQVQFALEQQIEQLAALAQIDPLEFRRMNLKQPDDPGPLDQVVVPFDGASRALDVISRHALWQGPRRWRDDRYLHGVGMAPIQRSDGYGKGGPNGAKLALALAADGCIELRASFCELGQNLIGSICRLTALELGCDAGDVRAVIGDSALPDSGAVAASRATTLVWRAIAAEGAHWSAQLCKEAASLNEVPVAALRLGPGGIWCDDERYMSFVELAARLGERRPVLPIDLAGEETPTEIAGAHYVFGACAALAHVIIDTWTGAISVDRLVVAAALGPVVSRQGFLGQMEGGALIGQGLVTIEALPMAKGRYLARNFDSYFIPTFADAPQTEVIAIENLMPGDRHGPRGAGEIGANFGPPQSPTR